VEQQHTMEPVTEVYREYEIVVTRHEPCWQAAVYRTRQGLPEVDWTTHLIRAATVQPAVTMAKQRIDLAQPGVPGSPRDWQRVPLSR
jgi:hypothetical protein